MKKDKVHVYRDPKKNEDFFKDNVGMGLSFDLGVRKIYVHDQEIQLYYVNGLCDTQYVIYLLKELIEINDNEPESDDLARVVENRLVNQQVSKVETLDEAVDQVLSGLVAVVVEGENYAFIIDVRSYLAECRRNRIQKRLSEVQETALLKTSLEHSTHSQKSAG